MDSNTETYMSQMLEVERQKVEALQRIADALERLSPPTKNNPDVPQKLGFVQSSFFG